MLQPVFDEPALVVEGLFKSLVVADLHLGIEYDLLRSGISVPSTTDTILDHLLRLLESEKPDRLILLGDVKHGVPWVSGQEKAEVPRFLSALLEKVAVDIVPGNHDASIEELSPKGVTIYPSKGVVIDGVGYLHGHTWPDAHLLSLDEIVMAHNHPSIRLVDELGHALSEPAWIRTHLNEAPLQMHYGEIEWADPVVSIIPAFNELCGGVAFNESSPADLLGPLFSSSALRLEEAEAYLLDGTRLGTVGNLRGLPLTRSKRK